MTSRRGQTHGEDGPPTHRDSAALPRPAPPRPALSHGLPSEPCSLALSEGETVDASRRDRHPHGQRL
ncbi:hypothetical protein AAFF_G00275710 [Aldrovandia affinis]|uniref:Uncharacterized protein n=1 Tax=Aldrovandia affinis TaxID=143900 RepID=A0AAD7RAJ1_9TELE|nr:hypothetical protein AAFF_G00275710 [Aldrovandia affinis]